MTASQKVRPPNDPAVRRGRDLGDTLRAIGVNVAGKGLAFVREAFVSAVFGVSRVTDAYYVAQQFFLLPYTYILGAFCIAFVPGYAKASASGQGPLFLRRVLQLVMLGSLVAMPVCAFAALGSFPSSQWARLAPFLVVMAWSVPCFAVNGLACGVLYAEHAQARGAVTSASVNWAQGFLLVLFALFGGSAGWVLSGSFTVGAFVGLAVSAMVVRRRLPSDPDKSAVALRSFGRQLGASSAENVGFSLNQLATVTLAARLGPGVVTINALAFRLSNLPLAAVGTPLSQSLQSWLVQDVSGRVHRIRKKIAGLAILWLAIAGVMVLSARLIVTVVYKRGAFTAGNVDAVAGVMTAYLAYFVVMATNQMCARVLFALDRGSLYARAMIPAYVVETLTQVLISRRFGLQGMIWAAAGSEGAAALVLLWRTIHRVREVGATPSFREVV